MKKRIVELIKQHGISATGIYGVLPEMILEAVQDVDIYGFEYWEQRTVLGAKVKAIVKELTTVYTVEQLSNGQIEVKGNGLKLVHTDINGFKFNTVMEKQPNGDWFIIPENTKGVSELFKALHNFKSGF
jgi:ribosome maturation protein Sdo1